MVKLAIKMYLTFMDESGGIGFSEKSIYKYFVMTALTIEEGIERKIKAIMKKKKAKLYNLGWPRDVEIKAVTLHNLRRNKKIKQMLTSPTNGDNYIQEVLISIKNSCHPRIDYLAINKDGIKDKSLKSADYGIAYNLFAGKFLCPLVKELKIVKLFADPRNKERHSKKHFEAYIKTEIIKMTVDDKIETKFDIQQPYSHMNLGLQAVDFFSWSIYRYFVNNDSRFYDVFSDLIVNGNKLYFEGE